MNNDNLKYLTKVAILFLLLTSLVIFLCFSMEKAQALEITMPYTNKVVSGSTYYGYNIPTRPTSTSASQDNAVFIIDDYRKFNKLTNQFSSSYTFNYSGSYNFKLRSLPNYITDYISTNNLTISNIPEIWTDTYIFDKSGNSFGEYSNLVLGFHPALSSSNTSEMLSNGFEIDYNQYYSYTFDIILYNESNDSNLGYYIGEKPYQYFSTNGLMSSFTTGQPFCTTNNGVETCQESFSTNSNNGYDITEIINNENIQYFRVKVLFNDYNRSGFTESYELKENYNEMGVLGKNMILPYIPNSSMIVNRFTTSDLSTTHTKVVISQPYDITLWSTSESLYCQENCWTQEDTNNYQEEPFEEQLSSIYSLFNDLNYYGFSGVVNLTFDYILRLLNNVDTSCIQLDIPILGKTITLPSSCTFWNREDISTFETFYQFMWLGLVSYFLAWKIFKDILNIYNPNTNIVQGKEVDSL